MVCWICPVALKRFPRLSTIQGTSRASGLMPRATVTASSRRRCPGKSRDAQTAELLENKLKTAASYQKARRLFQRLPRARHLPLRRVTTHRARSARADCRARGDIRRTGRADAVLAVWKESRRGRRGGETETAGNSVESRLTKTPPEGGVLASDLSGPLETATERSPA